jgi:hypothetical protein
MPASLGSQPQSKAKEPVLTPKLPPHWALGPAHLAITAVWVMIFLLFSYLPLRSTDLWGHTLWGQWILEHHQLPTEDPFAPLAAGMKVVDSAWLSQIIFATVERSFGPVGLSVLFSTTVLATLLLLARSFYLQSRSSLLMMLGVALVLIVGWSRATTLRPENFAALAFAIMIWFVTGSLFSTPPSNEAREQARPRSNLLLWLALPALFCAWANLHGSYLVGLAFLGCIALGTAIDVGWRERSFGALFKSADVQRWVFLTELCLLATLINPYGLELLTYNLTFAANPNLQNIIEWQPLVVLGIGGREFALSIVLLLILWRVSRAPVSATQVLLLALFSFAALKSLRMIGWYAPVFAWVVMPHLSDLWSRWRPSSAASQAAVEPVAVAAEGEPAYQLPPGRSFHYTLICGLLIWVGFAFSPAGNLLLGGKPRTDDKLFDKQSSPLKVAEYLAKNPPQGQVFQPQHWGDWLVLRVPGIQPFMTSNIHLAPEQVVADYERIASAQPGWARVLDRYHVTTLVLDKEAQPIIVQAMKQATDWALAYEDDQAVVYVRRQPAKSQDQKPPTETSAESLPGGERPDTRGEMP